MPSPTDFITLRLLIAPAGASRAHSRLAGDHRHVTMQASAPAIFGMNCRTRPVIVASNLADGLISAISRLYPVGCFGGYRTGQTFAQFFDLLRVGKRCPFCLRRLKARSGSGHCGILRQGYISLGVYRKAADRASCAVNCVTVTIAKRHKKRDVSCETTTPSDQPFQQAIAEVFWVVENLAFVFRAVFPELFRAGRL